MSTQITNLFEVARYRQMTSSSQTFKFRPCGMSAEQREINNSSVPSEPAKSSWKEVRAKRNAAAKAAAAKARRQEAARIKMAKECLEILRFGGKVIFSLPSQVLRSALSTAKVAGDVAFRNVVREYADACVQFGVEFDLNCNSYVAKEAHKIAKSAEAQVVKESLRESLREYFEEAGVTVYSSRAQQVANESIQTREGAAQAVKHVGRYAHLEAACPRCESQEQIIASVERAINGTTVEATPVVVAEEVTEVPEVTEAEKVTGTNTGKHMAYNNLRRAAKEIYDRLPEGKVNDADAIRKEKAQAVVDYYSSLISTVRKALKGTMTEEQVSTANKEAAEKLATVTKDCKAKLATFRKGRKSATAVKAESKKGKSKGNK